MKKILGVFDIVLMNVAAILALRWLPIAAGYGAASVLLWVLAAGLFFIPLGLVVAMLASVPNTGRGMYDWVQQAFGEKCAFITSWFYLINNLFYFTVVLIFISVILAYMIKPAYADHSKMICVIALIFWWFIFWASCRSLNWVRRFIGLSGIFGAIIPGLMIIVLSLAAVFIFKHPIPTSFAFANWLPKLGSGSNIVFLSTLMFAMAGVELTPILSAETKEAQKTFAKAIFISALFIVSIYVIGTLSMLLVLPPHEITASAGIVAVAAKMTAIVKLPFLLFIFGGLLILGQLGAMQSWFVPPAKMFLENVRAGSLPAFLNYVNKNDMPTRIMLAEAIIVSLILIAALLFPTLNIFYETIVLMAGITYFIPFIFIFLSFIKLKRAGIIIQKGHFAGYLSSGIGLFSIMLAIVLPFIVPPSDIVYAKDIFIYRLELFSGPFVFGLLGGGLYWYAKKS